ncbi:MurR/RpiR family transcriptional regulator [Ruania alba]|uniref:DNA-binding transcriptional regulator, MurR/RpiR family, contains HTH and SIS domains n=1 Tax=Ruania alba TaxID=648782 RepID=A0A1H5GHU7_9MICO|nr:MurR/RpiR family transcriptional regulator [Ruania alba]SEE15001.1 DNA-binding transcriptional regulator, MurR/RpiR family, contains HTH and SIS domains [Ruania alba]
MRIAQAEVDRTLRVAERIHANRPLMSAAMDKIADVLLEDPTAPLELSITELAERAGTSPATVTRFCRQLGYPGYVQFRVGVATDSGRGDTSNSEETWRAEMGRALDPDDTPEDVLRALLNAHVRSLRATADVLDLDIAASVAHQIGAARHLDIYGTGGSFAMAEEMRTRLYRIGVNAHAWGDVHAGLASASILDEQAIAIGISNSGRTRETLDMLDRAKLTGAHTVAITSFRNSPLAQTADCTLLASVPEQYLHPADLSAKHSQLFVLDVLYLLVAQLDYSATVARIAASADAVASHRRPD